jgi:integrase/recombinase XerD
MRPLGQLADEYLQLRRVLGHKMEHGARLLPQFVSFLEGIGAEFITIEATLAWEESSPSDPAPASRAQRMAVASGFARYLVGVDPRTEVPPTRLLPYPRQKHPPFIYSPDDIAALMTQARGLQPPLRSATYETLIGLLASTGMRVGEAARLDRTDVNLAEGVLVVRMSKFGKSREVLLHPSTTQALTLYARKRDEVQLRPKDASFFISGRGKRLEKSTLHETFRHLVDSAGVGAGAPVIPRIHDLRHSFAVRTLVRWYRDGKDVQAWLPRLSTYLGHLDPHSTYWYLSAAPELLALAAGRLEAGEEDRK